MKEKIGDALIKIGAITPEQVEKVLKKQKSGDSRMFGEIAIEQGFIDDEAIKTYLDSQTS